MECGDGGRSQEGIGSLRIKSRIFHSKWRVLVPSDGYFCPCPRQKNVEFSAQNGDLVNDEFVLLGSRPW